MSREPDAGLDPRTLISLPHPCLSALCPLGPAPAGELVINQPGLQNTYS